MKAKNQHQAYQFVKLDSVEYKTKKSFAAGSSIFSRHPITCFIFLIALFIIVPAYGDTIPIKLHPTNSHYFEFRGEPTILITSAEQYSSIQNLDFDYIPYLDELEDNGLNYTRIFCGVYINGMAAELPRLNGGQVFMPIGSPLYPDTINADLTKGLISPWARSDSAGYWAGGNKFDLDTWDTLYFSRLVDFVSRAGIRGIIVEVTFYCGYGGEKYWKFSPMNYINNINNVGKFGTDYGPYDTDSTNIGHLYPLTLIASENDGLLEYQEAMVEKHIDELKDFDNVFFEAVNEPYFADAGATVINQNGEHCGSKVGISTEWQANMIKVILDKIDELDNDFLVAQNIDHFYEKAWVVDDTISPINMNDFRDIYPGVDILNFHYAARYARYVDRSVGYNYGLNRPVGQDENGYVGGEDHTYRKQGWNYIIGGGGIYNNLDLSYTTNGYEGGRPTNPSAGYGGSPELHEQYGILKEFIHNMDFIYMTPNNDLPKIDGIITEIKPSDVVIRCLANEGEEYIVYVEGGTQVDLTFDLPAGTFKAEWINTKARDAGGDIIIDKSEIIVHSGDTVTISSPTYTEEDIAFRLFAYVNTAPVIDTTAAAEPDTVTLPNTINLSVYASDPDRDTLNFLWTKVSGPGGVAFSPNDTTLSNTTIASFDTAGSYNLQVAVYDPFDTVYSNVFVNAVVEVDALPFTEDWESVSGSLSANGLIYSGINYSWEFETDNPNEGRVRWGSNAFLYSSGYGALTLDKFPNDGDYATNAAILTIDLSAFTADNLELEFSWADHKDEEQSDDKVWIRGNNSDLWVEIFDFDPVSSPDGVFQQVSGLDIDNNLANASPPQVVSATFQVKFGQKDNSFTPGDGISIDDISITSLSTVVVCNNPSGLSTNFVAPSYAELAWTENGAATSWEIRLGNVGFDTTGITPENVGTNPYSWTVLDPNSSYDWYVRANCGGGTHSGWTGPHNFTTPDIGSDVLPFTEDWESSSGSITANGLIYSGSNYSWEFETDNPGEGRVRWGTDAFLSSEGTGALTLDKYPNDGDFATNAAILTIDLSAFTADDLELEFWWTDHKDEEQSDDRVWIRGNNTAQWVEIFDFDPVSSPDGVFRQVTGLDIDTTLASASPPQVVSATFQVKFGQKDNSFTPGDGISIDDISITSLSTVVVCNDPSDLSTNFVAPSYAELVWTENGAATSWEIRFGEQDFDTTGIIPAIVETNPHTWTGLNPNSSYDWYVRSNCGGGTYSGWTGPHSITTPDINSDVLPFNEDWETSSGAFQVNGIIYSGSDYMWEFETDNPNEGRVRWGTNAFLKSEGSGALTLDKYPNDGDFATNAAILTIDLSAFTADNLELAFSWTDHMDEEQGEDKVWIRGNNTAQWVQIFDFDPALSPNGIFQKVTGLDIDNVLGNASPPQDVSATFQIKFGQKDNSFTPGDGISIDDISIISLSEAVSCIAPSELTVDFVASSLTELSWTENGSAVAWQIILGNIGFDTTGTTPVSVGTNPYTWTGLCHNNSYDWYVRADCGGGDYSSWTGPHNFTTPDNSGDILPFTEDWESSSGTLQTNGLIYSGICYSWKFETDNPSEGRVRWGTDAYLPYAGSGAITFDKFPNDGDFATNAAILTIDLSAFSTDDIEMDFWWTDHADEDQPDDKVWIRGNNSLQWVEIYDFDPASSADGTFQHVSGLDIDFILSNASPPQEAGAAFQVKFGQKDNSFTPGDGISVDDITIDAISTDKSAYFNGSPGNDELFIYSHNGWLYLVCNEDLMDKFIDIQLIDIFGKTIINTELPPGNKRSLYVGSKGNYFVVKVILKSKVITKKVYIN